MEQRSVRAQWQNKQHTYLASASATQNTANNSVPRRHVIIQAYICRFLPAQARVQVQDSTRGICGGKGENYTGFTSEFSSAIRFIAPTMLPTHSNIIWWGDGPITGHSSTRTPSHCITRLTTKSASQRRNTTPWSGVLEQLIVNELFTEHTGSKPGLTNDMDHWWTGSMWLLIKKTGGLDPCGSWKRP